jgi:NAD-dependent DNA ligase
MPDVPYHWTDTHVDIILDNIDEDDTVREKNITDFFRSIEVDGLSGGNVKRIVAAGFDSVPKILHMTKGDFEGVAGFKAKMVEKIHDGIRAKVAAASLMTIMAASNLFGRGIGERKLAPILEAYPNILTTSETPEEKVAMLRGVKGIGAENARAFVENIPRFMAFLQECDLEGKLLADETNPPNVPALDVDTSHPLYGKHIVMTKVRDKTIIEGLAHVGGVLDDGISKNTFALVVKSKEDVSNKTKYAVEHGIPIMTPAEFITAYLQ